MKKNYHGEKKFVVRVSLYMKSYLRSHTHKSPFSFFMLLT